MSALIKELSQFSGRITDIDTHEMIPAQEWVGVFGKEVQPVVDIFLSDYELDTESKSSQNIPNYEGDIAPIGIDIVNVKGGRAPGAMSIERRLDVMDFMGVKSQLLYPTGIVLAAVSLYKAADDLSFWSSITGDRKAKASRWFDLYNEWVIVAGRVSPRVRPCGVLFGDTPEELYQRADRLVKGGVRAMVYIPASGLPGGVSPAHPALDLLWALLAEADCPFTLHIEAEAPAKPGGWHDAPAFKGFRVHGEIDTNPALLATQHQKFENFLTYMILGGVFDRHPRLRMGLIEVGSCWLGPLSYRLDLWNSMGGKLGDNTMGTGDAVPTYRLPEPPSHYLRNNVRVAPFVFEDIATQIEVFGMGKTLCFSTDYPHVEGGRNAFSIFYEKIKHLGPQVIEDFFVNNGQLLLPD